MDEEDDNAGKPTYNLVFRVLLGTVITIENIILLLSVSKDKLQTNKYLFTASLGVTDLLVGVSVLCGAPFYFPFVTSRLGSKSIGTTVFVIVVIGMLMLSIVQMAIIAIERYVYIAHPFVYMRRLTPRVIRWTLAVTWVVGIVFIAAYGLVQMFAVGEYINGVGNGLNIFVTTTGLCGYFVIATVTLVCYVLILLQVRRHRRAINTSGAERTIPRWKEHAKVLKFFLTVFGVFFVTTAPAGFTELLGQFIEINENFRNTLLLIGIANSGMNFWILLIVDSKFREVLKKIPYACCARGE